MLGWVDNRPLSDLLPDKEAKALAKAFGYRTVQDLLEHYPRTWSHHGTGVNLDTVNEGDIVTCVGEIVWEHTSFTSSGKMMHKVVISDGSGGQIGATFFQAKLPARQLVAGARAMFSGKLTFYRGNPQLSHPTYVLLKGDKGNRSRTGAGSGGLRSLSAYGDASSMQELLSSMEFLPVYPGTKAVPSWRVLGAINEVLNHTDPVPEPLDVVPEGLVSFDEAVRGIHRPDSRGVEPLIERLKYNEALSLALVMALRRVDVSARVAPTCPPLVEGYRTSLLSRLPFALTDGQVDVLSEIEADLSTATPMSRLLQGEVGSGKTIVSLLAMLQVVDAGRQCALLAPTEVLAVQHARALTQLLSDAAVPATVVVLTGSMSQSAKKRALLDIVSGQADIVVGTHALIQEGVEFFDLGLVVVDEQHRFGVEQRDHLRSQGRNGVTPHLLVMTATPIPRTIAMTTFGDLAVSTLTELPGGRRPISTTVVPGWKLPWVMRAWQRIREEAEAGRQAYVVCPRIDGDGGVMDMFDQLSRLEYPDLNVGLLHGRMRGEEKDRVMSDFAAGGIDILVSTTVIEVGIDVPNATVMYIREADNFGVSQLHQLRGRVGRGGFDSVCLLHTDQSQDTPSYQRLVAIANTTDGFQLADIDLRSRQEGDVLGTAQSGAYRRVKFLNFLDDAAIIERATEDAEKLVARNKQLAEQLVSDVALERQEYLDKS